MSQWTTTSAEKKDTTVPTASPGRLAATSCSRACQRSQTVAPKIVGIARKKENSVAAWRESPKMRPPMIVAPERLVPGIIARHCATPTLSASFQSMSSISFTRGSMPSFS